MQADYAVNVGIRVERVEEQGLSGTGIIENVLDAAGNQLLHDRLAWIAGELPGIHLWFLLSAEPGFFLMLREFSTLGLYFRGRLLWLQ